MDDSRKTYHQNDRSDSEHRPLNSFVVDSPFVNKNSKEEEKLRS